VPRAPARALAVLRTACLPARTGRSAAPERARAFALAAALTTRSASFRATISLVAASSRSLAFSRLLRTPLAAS